MPGDDHIERQIRSLIRWNALAMVVRANQKDGDLGGHISTFASAATLYEVGFNHFFRGPSDSNLGDLIYYQGHSSPGIYARSFLEGRLDEQHLDNFRQETGGRGSIVLSSSEIDAGLLAISYGFYGIGTNSSNLSSPCDEVSRRSRSCIDGRPKSVGISWRRRV